MKIVYIAHPISGAVTANLDLIVDISRTINLREPEVVPLAPYFLDCIALDDSEPMERRRGIRNNIAVLKSGIIKELRLYGNTISAGMAEEIKIAKSINIPIRAMTRETKKLYFANKPVREENKDYSKILVAVFLCIGLAMIANYYITAYLN